MANIQNRISEINEKVELHFINEDAKEEYLRTKAHYQGDAYHRAIAQCADEIGKVAQYNAYECGHPIGHAIELAVDAVSNKKYSSLMFVSAIDILKDKWKYGTYLEAYDRLIIQTGLTLKDCLSNSGTRI